MKNILLSLAVLAMLSSAGYCDSKDEGATGTTPAGAEGAATKVGMP